MTEHQRFRSGRQVPYSDDQLFEYGPPGPVTGERLREVAFPLGGIGTGCLWLTGRGELIDWEIFNRPNKAFRPHHGYFLLHTREAGAEPVFRVMEGRIDRHFHGRIAAAGRFDCYGFGPSAGYGSGFLRFAECSFTGRFPIGRIDLSDPAVPVRVCLEAWSPFIPLEPDRSSYPAAIFTVTLTSCSGAPVDATVALGLPNVVGWPECGQCRNEWAELDHGRGLVMTSERHAPDSPRYGSLALVTPQEDVTYQLRFDDTAWFGEAEGLMDGFGVTGRFAGPTAPVTGPEGRIQAGHLGVRARLEPGESRTLDLILCWHMPNVEMYWSRSCDKPVWKAYHGTRWESAREVADEVLRDLPMLRARTFGFADAFFSSTLPTYVLDAVATQASILRTPTVARLPNGTLWAWEGCHTDAGCCDGTCTHVWAYAQTPAHLFPSLERDARVLDFDAGMRPEDGFMRFRIPIPPYVNDTTDFHACADAQMGNILRTYREWRLSGDDAWLRARWPQAKRALEYAWVEWDADRDGILEGHHHSTFDTEFRAPETVCGSMYLAALRAGEEMARRLGDEASAETYRGVFESGRQRTDAGFYNGEYYYQPLPEGPEQPYQYGPGCICDQVLGQWHARMLGLGDILDPEHVRSALAAVYRHNFRDDLLSHHNPHRVFAVNDDKGLIVCTWPHGGRPQVCVAYGFECWPGLEYEVGSHLVMEGMLREGLTLCKAVRERHDGVHRNPYNEFECGSHYARSMSSYAYLLALSGLRYSAPERALWWSPALRRGDFRCFFSVEGAWGVVSEARTDEGLAVTIEVREGALRLDRLVVDGAAQTVSGDPIEPGRPLTVSV